MKLMQQVVIAVGVFSAFACKRLHERGRCLNVAGHLLSDSRLEKSSSVGLLIVTLKCCVALLR